MSAALSHGEFEAVNALIARGAQVDLPAATGMGRTKDASQLLSSANSEDPGSRFHTR
jgi:hypothetical protein